MKPNHPSAVHTEALECCGSCARVWNPSASSPSAACWLHNDYAPRSCTHSQRAEWLYREAHMFACFSDTGKKLLSLEWNWHCIQCELCVCVQFSDGTMNAVIIPVDFQWCFAVELVASHAVDLKYKKFALNLCGGVSLLCETLWSRLGAGLRKVLSLAT